MTLLAWATIAAAIIAEALMIRVWWRQRGLQRPARTETHYTIDELVQMREQLWRERGVTTTMVYDAFGEPVAGFDTTGVGGAVWDWETGAPE